jgi:hypothetical protein
MGAGEAWWGRLRRSSESVEVVTRKSRANILYFLQRLKKRKGQVYLHERLRLDSGKKYSCKQENC